MTRLLLDVMLGKLATYLRMCGHDAAYALDRGVEADDALLAWAREEDRTLVTRDRELAARADASVLIESKDTEDKLRELAAAGVPLELDVPSRCANCNAELCEMRGDAQTPEHVPDTAEQPIYRCPDCDQYFWRGSHWDDVSETVENL